MVNMKRSSNLGFCNSAPLTGVSIAASGALCLALPVWTVIGVESAAPCRVARAGHACLMRLGEAFTATVLIATGIDLISFTLKLFAACATCYRQPGIRNAHDTACALPSAAAPAAAKVVFLYGTRRLLDTLAAPIARHTHFSAFALGRTVKHLGGAYSVGLYLNSLATRSTNLLHLGGLCGATTFLATVFPLLRYIRLKHFDLAARRTGRFNKGFRATEITGAQFVGTFSATSCPLAVVQATLVNLVGRATYRAYVIYFHRGIIAQMFSNVKFCGSGSEVIGAILAGWQNVTGIDQDADYLEIAQRRVWHWIGYQQSLPVQTPLLEAV